MIQLKMNVYKAHVKTASQFDNVYSQFKDEENSSEENSATFTNEENEESTANEDFVTHLCWVREERKIKKKTISKLKNEFEVLEVLWKKMLCLQRNTSTRNVNK